MSNPKSTINITHYEFGEKEARAICNERKNRTECVRKVKDDVLEIEGQLLKVYPTVQSMVHPRCKRREVDELPFANV